MKRAAPKSLILAVVMVVTSLLVPACEEQTLSDSQMEVRRTRMIAADLKNDIKTLKKQHARELADQQKLLKGCLKEKKALEELSSKGVKNYMNEFFVAADDQADKLQVENNSLKGQVERLNIENQMLVTRIEQLNEQIEQLKSKDASAQ
jgi:hypothetical protein